MHKVVVALAGLMLIAVPTGAQLSTEEPTLYLHRQANSGPFFLNTLVEDGAYTNSGYNVLGIGLSCSGAGYCWSGNADPAPPADVPLDIDRPIIVQVALKTIISVYGVGTVGDGPGYGDVLVDLSIGGQSWGSFSKTGHQFSGAWELFTWEVLPKADTVPAGAPIGLDVMLDGVSAGAVIGMSPKAAQTLITFPVPAAPTGPAAPVIPTGPVYGAPFGGEGTVLVATSDLSSQNHFYNWTNPFTNFAVRGAYNGTGNVTVTFNDESNTTVYQQRLSGNGSISADVADALPGNWTILVDLTEAVGEVRFAITEIKEGQAPPSGGPTTTAATPTSTTTTAAGNATSDEAPSAEESPGFEAVALLALLGAVAALIRRRK